MSSIDLALCSPAIALNYHWQPKNDTFGSDHFPIIISSTKSSSPSPQFQQYWKINKADWTNFAQKCENSLNENANITSIEQFVDSLVSISNDTIPKTRSKMKRIKKPWFTDDCKQSITQRKKALRNLRNHPTSSNIDRFRICRAKARRTMREAKRISWKNFVSKINSNTPSRRIWNMLHKIQGNDISQPVKHLKVNNNSITDTKEIANTLANAIAYNSSSNHYSPTFQSHKTICEKNDIRFPPADNESYNLPITFTELTDAIRTAHDSSPGPDLIHYQILKHLPYNSLKLLLTILNKY